MEISYAVPPHVPPLFRSPLSVHTRAVRVPSSTRKPWRGPAGAVVDALVRQALLILDEQQAAMRHLRSSPSSTAPHPPDVVMLSVDSKSPGLAPLLDSNVTSATAAGEPRGHRQFVFHREHSLPAQAVLVHVKRAGDLIAALRVAKEDSKSARCAHNAFRQRSLEKALRVQSHMVNVDVALL